MAWLRPVHGVWLSHQTRIIHVVAEATERHRALLTLDERQLAALDVLCAGGSHKAAAQAAGVDRVTVTRWNTRHPAFMAERPVDVYDALVQFEAKARYRDPLLAFIETTDEIEARAAALAEATAALLDACQ
jgi:hypothetical protein